MSIQTKVDRVPETLLALRRAREQAEERARAADAEERRALALYALEMSPFKVGDRFTRERRSWSASTPRTEQWQVVSITGLWGWRGNDGYLPGVIVVLHCVRVLASGDLGLQRTEIRGDIGQPGFFADLRAAESGEETV